MLFLVLSEPKCGWDPQECVEISDYVADLLEGLQSANSETGEVALGDDPCFGST